ncbi:UPF0403 protein SA1345 [Paraliobacillus ryukyuensis]|uniref:Putative YphP/YqiW family bacilliredoxin n=1 Tax=Paraliobacillus ryukyuensis TaxID=200904 RepID=A0A366EIB3_9BACI|nr:BrxA/BrxB family bacilliredoxin [Paraliobacillus ryukyuensis]RBP01460.1 putative YphP/YqiW family bacilliredoxin [Paraliobacillus ryukyuensis]
MEFNLYMGDRTQASRDEIVTAGYQELTTPEQVDEVMQNKGTTLVMVNSNCGCAGGVARPAAAQIMQAEGKPDHAVTVFAGQDKEATEKARSYFKGYAPSSPSFALLKDGSMVTMVERHEIEGHQVDDVVAKLQAAMQQVNK